MRRLPDPTLHEKEGRAHWAGGTLRNRCGRLVQQAWQFATMRIKQVPRAEASAVARGLAEEKVSLHSLVSGMETEFLETGEGLKHLARQLAEIQQECRSLSDLTMGQTPDAAVQFAFQLLKKAEDLVLASCDQYDHVFATFSELQRRIAQLAKQHDELMRVLLPLNFITMSLRIEASRQPAEVQAVFVSLAMDLNRTVDEVRATLELQFTGLAAGERIIQTLVEELSAAIQQHRHEVAVALVASRSHLRALSEALSHSGAGAAELAQLNRAVTRHIGGIVMAQQCQDITRQKIDHVGEAMDEMRDHLDAFRPATTSADSAARQFVLQAGQIQLHQVQAVFAELTRAAGDLQSGILNLRTDARAAGEAAVKVGNTALDAKAASLCQAGLSGILAIIDQAARRIADILIAFEPLQATFVNCTTKATALAGDVRHAALNAQVFAIHAPDGGTLEVLAGRVNAVSDEAIKQVGQMGAALHHTAEMVNNLRQRLLDFQELSQAERETLNDESALSTAKLADLDRTIPVLVGNITQRQGAFAQSVDAVLAKVLFPATVAEASSRSVGFFQNLVAWSGRDGAEAEVESAASQKIDRLKSNYTMESERRAHAAVLQPVLVAASAAAGPPAVEFSDDVASSFPATGRSGTEITLGDDLSFKRPPPAPESASGTALPASPVFPEAEKSAEDTALGDNVELF